MHNRLTSRRRPATGSGAKGNSRQANTVPAQGETQEKVPRMPHERDESADSQAGPEPSGKRLGSIAQQELRQGQKDTGKAPALDAAYQQQRK